VTGDAANPGGRDLWRLCGWGKLGRRGLGRPTGATGGTGAHAARPYGVRERAACGGGQRRRLDALVREARPDDDGAAGVLVPPT
jgi:hypothetical protein